MYPNEIILKQNPACETKDRREVKIKMTQSYRNAEGKYRV